jgi:TPR repeat protein
VYIKGGLGLSEAERKSPDALTWIRRSAENDDVVSIEALAAAYTSGQYGITPDPKQAADLTAKANKLRGLDAKGKKKR